MGEKDYLKEIFKPQNFSGEELTFPFCYIPAFAPATIIFLHLSVYHKLIQAKK